MASGANRRSSLVERASAISNVLYISDVRQAICRKETTPFDDNITFDQLKAAICKVKKHLKMLSRTRIVSQKNVFVACKIKVNCHSQIT